MHKNWYELQKETQTQVPLTFQKFSFFFFFSSLQWVEDTRRDSHSIWSLALINYQSRCNAYMSVSTSTQLLSEMSVWTGNPTVQNSEFIAAFHLLMLTHSGLPKALSTNYKNWQERWYHPWSNQWKDLFLWIYAFLSQISLISYLHNLRLVHYDICFLVLKWDSRSREITHSLVKSN